jgi:FkbM family methyltransferase
MHNNLKSLIRKMLSSTPRPHRIWNGNLRGYRIVTSWHDYPSAILGYTERPLLDWFTKNVQPRETWLDIGAHYGYTAIALSRLVGGAGRVFAFEPMLSSSGYLAQTRALNMLEQLVVMPFGLGAPETFMFRKMSVLRGMAENTIASEADWYELILLARFDWLWQKICGGSTRVHGIKIDVQGMEIDVLRGMTETLKRQRPKLVIEMHCGVNRDELLMLIEDIGYSRIALPVEPIRGEVEPKYIDDHSYVFSSQ